MNKYYKILELDNIISKLKSKVILESNANELDEVILYDDIDSIERALNEVDEAVKLIYRMGRFPLYFKENVTYVLDKVNKHGVLLIDELLLVKRFLDTTKEIELYIESLENALIDALYLKENTKELVYLKNLNLRIREIVDSSGEVLDTASSELRAIRRSIREAEKNIQSKLQEIISKNGSKLSQSVVSIRDGRYVVPVKNDFKGSIKGIVHGESSSGETVYIEPLIICEINNKLNALLEEEKREIFRILKEISSNIAVEYDLLVKNYYIIEKLDLIFSKAELSIALKGNKPKVNNKGIVNLKNCHHPLLNVEKVISNDIVIGKDYQGIIITGPNTGGKTVLLKTIGLLSLMVKMGLLIPCDEDSDIMIFDNVYADIGDEQSIDQNLSTFSSHLKNVIEIMNNVTPNSLVLIDELGSGTDPIEGSSLAIAIFDYLLSKKCLVITSSHYAELKVHAYNRDDIINASVEFDINTLKPTYKLLIGVPGESNALKISKLLGLPEEIIKNAEGYVNKSNNEINQTLEKLIERSYKLNDEIEKANKLKVELNEKVLEAERKIEEAYKEREAILKKAEDDSKKLLEKNQNKIDELIAKLSELNTREIKSHEVADLKYEYRNLKNNTNVDIPNLPENKEICEKDRVFVITYNAYGEVIKKLKNGKFEVQIGNASITVSKDNLKLAPNANTTVLKNKQVKDFTPTKKISMSLDLRGLRYEEAEPLIDDYIYDAIYAGFNQVTIIHGFGTGVMRELVQKKVKNNPNIESFRYGGQNEGGNGVTVVTLKK